MLELRPLQASDGDVLFWEGARWFLTHWLKMQEDDLAYTAVAVLDGQPVGRCGVNFSKDPDMAWIWAAHVEPEYRGRGIGQALLIHLEGKARERGFRQIGLGVGKENPDAERLYQRLGYRRYGEEVGRWSYELKGRMVEEKEDCWLLRKPL